MTINKAKVVLAAVVATILTGMSSMAAAPGVKYLEQTGPDAKPPKDGPVEELALAKVLQACDQTRNQIQSLHGFYKIMHLDNVLRRQSVDQAEVWYVKPDLLRIDWHSNQPRRMVFVCTKEDLTYFDFLSKRQFVRDRAAVVKTPPESGFFAKLSWSLANGGIELEIEGQFRLTLLGISSEEAATRFKVSIAKQDQHYVYLRLASRLALDCDEFEVLYLALDKKSYQVRGALFHEPNGNETKFEVTKIEINPQPPTTRAAVLNDLPKGWMCIK